MIQLIIVSGPFFPTKLTKLYTYSYSPTVHEVLTTTNSFISITRLKICSPCETKFKTNNKFAIARDREEKQA